MSPIAKMALNLHQHVLVRLPQHVGDIEIIRATGDPELPHQEVLADPKIGHSEL